MTQPTDEQINVIFNSFKKMGRDRKGGIKNFKVSRDYIKQ